jgi:hypothetical protein
MKKITMTGATMTTNQISTGFMRQFQRLRQRQLQVFARR